MKKRDLMYVVFCLFGILLVGCGGNTTTTNGSKKTNGKAPEISGIKCEFVSDGGEAVVYGKNLVDAEVIFPGGLAAEVNQEKSNDTMLVVIVPQGTTSGKICVKTASGEVKSKFFFRDDRNIIINFDDRLATWGGYEPFDENGQKMTETLESGDEMAPLPATLPDPCSGKYGFLYGKYNNPWSMTNTMYIQYVADPDEGGRGPISVAGEAFESYDLDELALRFEVYVPEEVSYKGVKTEIFFGPYDSPDKHGRDVSPICFWEPYQKTGSFFTDGWQTITIPLTQFYHGIKTDEEVLQSKMNLKNSTNFSFVQFGAPIEAPQIFMCVDNFRIVPIAE